MAPKIFITGGTGYIGGSVLYTIVSRHPEYDVTALLRRVPDGFAQRYPNVRVVRGDYDSGDIISAAASEADIVVHNGDSDHEPSINAIIAGQLRRHEKNAGATPGFLIHLSGSGLLADWRSDAHMGKLNPKIWNDETDGEEIRSRPDQELHRNVDKIILAAAAEHADKLKTAIMCPPDIYGRGRGPGKQSTILLPIYVDAIKQEGAAFYVERGENAKSWVHIEDLMKLYLGVVEAAARGGSGADWGEEAYYFAGTQVVAQVDLAKAVAKILKARGVMEHEATKSISVERACQLVPSRYPPPVGRYFYASSSRTLPRRAERLFGYQASAPALLDALEGEIDGYLES